MYHGIRDITKIDNFALVEFTNECWRASISIHPHVSCPKLPTRLRLSLVLALNQKLLVNLILVRIGLMYSLLYSYIKKSNSIDFPQNSSSCNGIMWYKIQDFQFIISPDPVLCYGKLTA
jgi:hypothetical protein